ncbi:CBS domain-containing protein [Chloropicon roscoffensis]|uniref:CBS domain-containing protein n=1 Tax=Chloropicon roscoffensis TaxID=1461544 RepID=A0AAX4P154_9CHLO|mmetsp:Transcript_4522/g.13695  ORF Transcript_4522/g.13695 Transcript_4522/m.13695 type:complete len:205 (-) Transcript_4522:68-682(-)
MNNVRLIGSRTKVAAACGAKPCRVHARQNATHRARFEGIKSFSTPDLSDSIDEDTIASGEWPANWSLASYEDVGEYYAGQVLKEQDANSVSGVMTTNILSADPTASVEDVRKLFDHVSGVPVVDSEGVCVGIVSKKDLNKKGSTVAQIMSAPARTIKKTNSVGEAAAIMLKYKVNRLPVVSRNGEVIGIVSRTDIFTALESMEE